MEILDSGVSSLLKMRRFWRSCLYVALFLARRVRVVVGRDGNAVRGVCGSVFHKIRHVDARRDRLLWQRNVCAV